MRCLLLTIGAAFVAFAAVPAHAMPFPPASDAPPGVTLIAQGCGPGWFRGPYGRCHPMGYARPAPFYRPYPYAYRPHCWWVNGVRVCR